MTNMKVLEKSDWRCAGIYNMGEESACPNRDTCLRYLSFRHFDTENGIENYNMAFRP